jgi:hypothetical protein
MDLDLQSRRRRDRTLLYAAGWILAVVVGGVLLWYGFWGPGGGERPEEAPPSPTASPTLIPLVVQPTPTPQNTPVPTAAPVPTVPPTPTLAPATPTSVVARIVAGEGGVNVRTGPSTGYTLLGYLEPGTEAELAGRYGDWWQIRYGDGLAWVFGELVTAYDAGSVSQVQPPAPPPTAPPPPPTAVPTAAPPTATPVPQDVRGLRANSYSVEGAPGPYGVGASIWFNFNVTNQSTEVVGYNWLGTWVEQTGQVQKSWSYSEFSSGQTLNWRDNINIPQAGTFNLWLAVEFSDGSTALLSGPVTVTVQ